MRERTQLQYTPYDDRWLVVPKDGSPSIQMYGAHGTFRSREQTIWDDPTIYPRVDGQPSVMKPTTHVQIWLASAQRSPNTEDATNVYVHNATADAAGEINTQMVRGFFRFPQAEIPFHADVDLPADVANALRPFVDSAHRSWEPISERFSLANDLLEWRETKSLFTDLASKFKTSGEKLFRARNDWKNSSDGTVNAFLAYNFGVAPLVSDIQDLAAAYYRIKTRLRFLKDIKGKLVTLHAANSFTTADTAAPAGWGTIDWQVWEGMQNASYRFVVGARLFSDLKGLDDASAYVRAFGAYAGFDKPLKIAWNAIPYSFLIDWCYNVGNLLESFRIPTFDGTWSIRDPWWSVKYVGSYHYTTQIPIAPGARAAHTYFRYAVKAYARRLGLLETPTPPWSTLQELLFGALAYQSHSRQVGKYIADHDLYVFDQYGNVQLPGLPS